MGYFQSVKRANLSCEQFCWMKARHADPTLSIVASIFRKNEHILVRELYTEEHPTLLFSVLYGKCSPVSSLTSVLLTHLWYILIMKHVQYLYYFQLLLNVMHKRYFDLYAHIYYTSMTIYAQPFQMNDPMIGGIRLIGLA